MKMPSKNKRRGNDFERLVVKLAQEAGHDSMRAWGSDGRSMGMHQEVDVTIDGRKYQCKKRKHIAEYMKPTEHVDGQIVMEDRGEPLIVFRLKDWLNDA
jgi:Holliday junction resolvase